MTKPIELGNNVKCLITGFEGIATSKLEYIDGSVEYGVTPQKLKDGHYPKVEYISSTRIKRVDDGLHIEKIKPELGFTAGTKK